MECEPTRIKRFLNLHSLDTFVFLFVRTCFKEDLQRRDSDIFYFLLLKELDFRHDPLILHIRS